MECIIQESVFEVVVDIPIKSNTSPILHVYKLQSTSTKKLVNT